MKLILTFVKIALFVVAITFAVMNTDVVAVRYYFGVDWRAPMVFVLLTAFGLGLAAGILVCLPHMVKSRFEVSRLKRVQRAEPAWVTKVSREADASVHDVPAALPAADKSRS